MGEIRMKSKFLLIASLWLFNLFAPAAQERADPQASDAGGQSVIIKLGKESNQARSVIKDMLVPRMAAVRDQLHAAAVAVAEAQERVEKEGTPEAQQNLDLVFGNVVSSVLEKLGAVLAEHEAVSSANSRLEATALKAQKEFEHRRADYSAKATDYQRQTEQIRAELDKLYQKYQPILARNGELPAEIVWKIQLANFQRHSMEERQKIFAKAKEALDKELGKMGNYAKLVGALRGQYEILFARCQDQMGLLSDWVGLRRDAAELRSLTAQIAETAKVLGEINTVSADIDRTIQGVDWGSSAEVKEQAVLDPAALPASSGQAAARAILESAHREGAKQ